MITVETRIMSFPVAEQGMKCAEEYRKFLEDLRFSTYQTVDTTSIVVFGSRTMEWDEEAEDAE